MSCTESSSALPLFVGGDLDAPEQRRLERHLAACECCRGELERLAEARAQLRGLAAASAPPPELWSELRRRMSSEGLLRAPRVAAAPPRRAFRWGWLPAAAALLLLGLGHFLAGDRSGAPGEDPGATGRGIAEGDELPEPVESFAAAPAPLAQSLGGPVSLRPLADDAWPDGEAVESDVYFVSHPPGAARRAGGVTAGHRSPFH